MNLVHLVQLWENGRTTTATLYSAFLGILCEMPPEEAAQLVPGRLVATFLDWLPTSKPGTTWFELSSSTGPEPYEEREVTFDPDHVMAFRQALLKRQGTASKS